VGFEAIYRAGTSLNATLNNEKKLHLRPPQSLLITDQLPQDLVTVTQNFQTLTEIITQIVSMKTVLQYLHCCITYFLLTGIDTAHAGSSHCSHKTTRHHGSLPLNPCPTDCRLVRSNIFLHKARFRKNINVYGLCFK
jgi:hypothetical protein